jgi:hypothetical protein
MARYRNFDGAVGATGETQVVRPALDDVRSRRAGLKAALSALELALAAPFANRAGWVMHVRESLEAVHDVWTRHIVETEAPGAFLDELVDEAPRLSTPAARLRREHNEILGVINRAEKALDQVLLEDAHDVFVDTLRADLTEMLCALAHHRQRGADLIYAAYDVDIGGG